MTDRTLPMQLSKEQINHIVELMKLVIAYVTDCDGCPNEDCPLCVEVTKHTPDLPELPSGLILCNLFDYISQNRMERPANESQA